MLLLFMDIIDDERDKLFFEKLYYTYKDRMFFIAKAFLKDEGRAEDAVQEAFIRIARNIQKFVSLECHETRNYIVIIIKSVCCDMIRKMKRSIDEVELCEEQFQDNVMYFMEDEIIEQLDENELINYFSMLSEGEQAVIELYFAKGYKTKEISRLLGISDDVVRKRISRGLHKLRKELGHE